MRDTAEILLVLWWVAIACVWVGVFFEAWAHLRDVKRRHRECADQEPAR